jgi:hypothetical protein
VRPLVGQRIEAAFRAPREKGAEVGLDAAREMPRYLARCAPIASRLGQATLLLAGARGKRSASSVIR